MTPDRLAPTRRERILIACLCVAGAVRVFVFSAAFPFFNNVDEPLHFDLVYKYAHGHLPAAPIEKFDPKAAEIIALSASGVYFDFKTDHSPAAVAGMCSTLLRSNNLETWAWPVYYILAGSWCWLGKSLSMADARLLYWIRFLNVPLIAVFVWLSWMFSRKFFNTIAQKRMALPVMVAFFPQDIFFAITGDVLSPIVFAAAFFMLLEVWLGEKSWKYHLFAGVAVAVTFLTKASNIAILPLAAGVILIKIIQAGRQKRLKQYLPCLAAFSAAAALPIALWLGRNYILFGDLIGAAKSMQARTWTSKPFGEMFNHPILTPSGLFYFLTELTKSSWRGEFVWHLKRIASPFMDWFYVISSAVFVTVSILGLIKDKAGKDKAGKEIPYRHALAAGLFVIVLSVMFLAVMSIRYDFGGCFYPSRGNPYFVSGRLIAGTILPFLCLYIDGLHRILGKMRCASCLLVVVCVIAAAITISEIIISLPAFACPDNWFHLL